MPQLLGNIYILSGYDLTHPWDASCYLIAGDDPVLIDCGSSLGYDALKRSLRSFGYEPSDIGTVLGTHGHWDHLSGVSRLREDSDVTLYLHPDDWEQVETGDPELTSAFLYNMPFPPTRVDECLCDEDALRFGDTTVKVLHTPGHTPGSVCFLMEVDSTRLLISGDTIWGGYSPRVHSNLDTWRQSLDRLVQTDFDVASIGHWSGLVPDARAKLIKAQEGFAVYFDPWFHLDGRGY